MNLIFSFLKKTAFLLTNKYYDCMESRIIKNKNQ